MVSGSGTQPFFPVGQMDSVWLDCGLHGGSNLVPGAGMADIIRPSELGRGQPNLSPAPQRGKGPSPSSAVGSGVGM